MSLWEVVGGADKGGILIREGQALGSPATAERLATGSIVEELELIGERLHYKLVAGTGTGPESGWASIKISGKDLLVPKEEPEDISPPSDPAPVEVDEALKAKIETDAKSMEGEFLNYCMKYKVLGFPAPSPKLRILCFHNAGGAETVYTAANTPFTNFVKENKDSVEVMAFDYPGRQKMLKKTKHVSTDTLSPELLAVAYPKLSDGVPYIVWAHSVGTWVCFEFLMAARKAGLPMPIAGFFNAFPAPHMPSSMRKWHKSARLNDQQMREELLNWDKGHLGPDGAGKVVFDDPGWKDTYEPQMRADFRLFDEYKFKHSGAPKFEFPIHAYHMELENYNSADQIEMWKDWTSGDFDHCTMANMGHLTCFYKPPLRKDYFTKVADHMKKYYGAL